MDTHDRYWIAGLLEGEGTFYNGSNGKYRYPCIQLAMTDKDIIDRAHAIIGGKGRVFTKNPGPVDGAPRQVLYTFKVHGQNAVNVMNEIMPIMGVRRMARMKEVISEFEQAKLDRATRIV